MRIATKSQVVSVTSKGQVVIPLRLRKEYEIKEGTKVIVTATPDGILLRPVTGAAVRYGYGILKRTPREESLADEWRQHKTRDRELEAS